MTPRRRGNLLGAGERPIDEQDPDRENEGNSDEENFNQPKQPDDRGGFYHKEFNTPAEQEAERRAPPASNFVGEGEVAQHFIAKRALVGLGYVRHSERFQFSQDFPLTRKRGMYAHAALEFLKIKHRDGVTRWTLATEPFSKGYEAVGLIGSEVIDQENVSVGGEAQWRTVRQVIWSITPTLAICSRLGLMLRPNGRTKSDILLEVKRNGMPVMVDYRMPFDELNDRANGQIMNLWLPMTFEPNATYTFRMHTEDGSTFDYFDPVPSNVPWYQLRCFDTSWLQNVKIVDTKTIDDFSSITGVRGAELTKDEKRALFDSDLGTSYTLPPGSSLSLSLKRAHRVHDIKILGTNGQVIEVPGAMLVWETVLDDFRIAEGQLFAEVKDEVTDIYIFNGSEDDLEIAEVLIEQFSDTRVHAPVHQPLNVDIRDEVVLEDIDRIELRDAGDMYVRDLTAGEIRRLFDKTVTNGEYFLIPDFHYIRIIFKKPQQVQEIETLRYAPGQNGDISGAQAIAVNYRIYSPDSSFITPVIETEIPTYNLEIKRKVSVIDVDPPDPLNGGGGVPVYEIMIKKFIHTDQEAPTVEISQRKTLDDIAYAFLGETPVPVADLAKLFDGRCSEYMEIPIGETLTIVFKIPNRVHGIKVLDKNGLFFPPYYASVAVLYPHWIMPYATVHDASKEIIVKEQIIGVAVTYSSPMSPPTIDVGEILIEEFNDQRVFSPVYQPNNVNIRDEVVYEDIDHIDLWQNIRQNGGWEYVRTLTDEEVFYLFNKNAMDNFGFTLPPDARLQIYFKKPLQVEEIETLAPPSQGIDYPTSIIVDYYVFPTDLPIGEEFDGQRRLHLHQKISAFWIGNPSVEVSLNIAEIMAKKFTHVETSVHGTLQFETVQRKTVNDVYGAYLNQDPLPQGELEALFDGNYITSAQLPPASAIQIRFKVPNRVHGIKLLDNTGNFMTGTDVSVMVIYPGSGWSPEKTFDPRGEMIVKAEIVEVIIINSSMESTYHIGELLCEEFNDQRVFSPVYQPNNVNIRDEVVYEDIASIELWENIRQNGGWEWLRDLTTEEIFRLFDKNNDSEPFRLGIYQKLYLKFKKPLQIEEIETIRADVPNDAVVRYTIYPLDGSGLPLIYDYARIVTVHKKITGFEIENLYPETEILIGEIIAKKFIHVDARLAGVGQFNHAQRKTLDDISSAYIGMAPMLQGELEALFDGQCAPTMILPPQSALGVLFKIPNRIRSIKLLDVMGNYFENSGNLLSVMVVYPGAGEPSARFFDPGAEMIIKDEITEVVVLNISEFPMNIGELLCEEFNDQRVHAPVYQPANVNVRDEVVYEDIEAVGYWIKAEQNEHYEWQRNLTSREIFGLFDKTVEGFSFPIDPEGMLRFNFKKPLQVEEIETLMPIDPQVSPFPQDAILDYTIYPPDAEEETTEDAKVLTVQKKIGGFDIVNPSEEDTLYVAEVIAKKFIHAHVPSSSAEVTIRDTKNASDFSSIALYVSGQPEQELTDAEKNALFNSPPNTLAYTLVPGGTLIFRLKTPHRIHTIKVKDRGMGMPVSQAQTILEVLAVMTFPNPRRAANYLFMEVKDEVATFNIQNNSQSPLDMGGVLVEQFSDVRVHSPRHQPNNVNVRDEVVLEDIAKVEVWELVEEELAYARDLDAQELAILFDKEALDPDSMLNVVMPASAMLRFIFKKPLQIEEIEALNGGAPPEVPYPVAVTLDYTIYPTDLPAGEPEEGVNVVHPREKISAFDIVNPSEEDTLYLTEIMAKKFLHAHVPSAGSSEQTVVVRDTKLPIDFARVYISDIGGDHDLTPEEIATMFDQDMTTFYALAPSTMLRFVFKTNHNLHHAKALNGYRQIITNPYIFINAGMTEPEQPSSVDGRAYIDIKGECMGIDINNSDTENPINIYEVIMKQMTYQEVEAPIEQPMNVTEQDYATPQDFDLLMSQSLSSPGISIRALIDWLSQRSSGASLPEFEVDPVVTLVPRNRSLQVDSIIVTEDAEGDKQVPYSHPGASIVVYPLVGDPITALETLYMPEVKCQVNKIVITLDHTQYWPRAIQIKKYVKREVFAPSQQPVKVEQDQEVTLQDVKAADFGTLSGDGETTWVPEEPPAPLTMAQIKALFDKGNSSGYVTVPDDTGIRIQFKTPKYVDEVEFLDEDGIDLALAPNGGTFTIYWQTMDGLLIGGDLLYQARAVVKAKVAAVIFYNASGDDADVYEAIIRLFNEQRMFGQEFEDRVSTPIEVDEDGVLAIGANPRRKFLVLFNDGNNVIKLSLKTLETFDDAPIVLNPKGAFYEFNWTNLWKGAVYAITDTNKTSTLKVLEGV